MSAKTLTGLLAGALATALCLWPTGGMTMNADANKIYVPRSGDDRQKLPKNPAGWETIQDIYEPISDIADWRKLVEKRQKSHWKPGNSAHETALSWFNANPDLPPEISALFGGAAELLAATPEHETPLLGIGKGSVSDVLAFVHMRGERCAVTVEGKKDNDDFDDTVEVWFEEAKTEGARNNRMKRLNGIYAELGLTNPDTAQIRYQLLHRSAAAVIEAKRFGADCAAMVVQSFSPKHTGFEDFAEFLRLFGIHSAKRDTLYTTNMPGMALHFGWVSSAGTVAAAPVPAKPESQPAQVAEVAAPSPTAPVKPQTGLLGENFVWVVSGALVLVLVLAGIFFWTRESKNSDTVKTAQPVEKAPTQTAGAGDLAATVNAAKTIDANKVKGDKFEDYVISKFNMLTEPEKKDPFLDRYGRHTLLERRSDKGEDGVFPESNKYPDLEVGCYLYKDEEPYKFAVECKFRSDYDRKNDTIQFVDDQEQLANYKKFAQGNDIPTFIVLGVGGYPHDPQRMFVIPLDSLKENEIVLTLEQLALYKQPGNKKSFFYHCKEKWLKFN